MNANNTIHNTMITVMLGILIPVAVELSIAFFNLKTLISEMPLFYAKIILGTALILSFCTKFIAYPLSCGFATAGMIMISAAYLKVWMHLSDGFLLASVIIAIGAIIFTVYKRTSCDK